ncbi:hypothetical protein [Altererythrobacter lutimaris]|uniref:Uncharacterized protein n=1 Tax=Altererythrobacter lutimaris TaxID=2743979 RepID=A0A850HD95_9SPHN|nr:hypothetical protein [Altererythrobacter lutimaris]NVE94976.1 hypothetical protein [Altererythrobacter lutimaris]
MMDWFAWLFAGGRAIDFVLVVIAAEAIVLKTRGWSLRELALMLMPAVLILLGLRAALVGAEWWWIAFPLLASLPVHLADVRQRKTRKP